MALAVAQAHQFQDQFHVLFALPAGQLGEEQGQFHVLKGRKHGDKLVKLEDEAHVGGPPIRQLGFGEGREIDAVYQQGAGVRAVQPGNEVKRVVFPEPEGPMSARNSPAKMVRLISSRTGSTWLPRR